MDARAHTWRPGLAVPADETPAFLEHHGEQLYVVRHHPATSPRERTVVLAGPLGLERTHASLTWVRWARTLAANGYETWRFDYRGVGESTGDFRAQTFETWSEDLEKVVEAAGSAKVTVLGLRLGALLASARGQPFLAWDPPRDGRTHLLEVLRRKLVTDYAEFENAPRRTREQLTHELEAGATLEVEGYPWSRALWLSAQRWTFQPVAGSHVLYLDGRVLPPSADVASVTIPRPPFWSATPLLVDHLDALFDATLSRLAKGAS